MYCTGVAPQICARLARVVNGCALVVIAVGVLVLAGWAFEIEALKRIYSGGAAMKVNTALGFVLCGAALWWRERRVVRIGAAALVALTGAVTMAQYLSGNDLGIDQLFYRVSPKGPEMVYPAGRMSPIAAVNFTLAGIALLCLGGRTALCRHLVQALGSGVLVISGVTLMAYVHGVEALYRIFFYVPVAEHAVATFIILAVGLFAAAGGGIASTMASGGIAGRLSRLVMPAVIGTSVLLSWLEMLGESAGLYDANFGIAVFTVAEIVMLVVIVWWAAQRIEQELKARRESENRYYRMFDLAAVGLGEGDARTGQILWANEKLCEITGYPAEELIGKPFTELTPLEDRQWAWQVHQQALREPGGSYRVEKRYMRKDGSIVWVRVNATVFERDGEAQPLRTIASVEDITERKQAEEALRREKEFADAVINCVPGIFYVIDANGRYLRWNKNMETVTGYSADEMARMIPQDFFAEQDRAYVAERVREAFEEGHTSADMPLQTKHGRLIPYLLTGVRIHLEPGPCVVGIGMDITDRKCAEEALRESEEQWRAVFENNPTMYFMVDAEGAVVSVNPWGASQLGYSVEELVGHSVLKVFYEPDREIVMKHAASCIQHLGTTLNWELRKIRKNGTMLWVRETARAMVIKNRTVILIVCEDITDRKRAEMELARLNTELERRVEQRTAELENANKELEAFSYSVSHDLRSPLRAVTGFATIFSEDYGTQLPQEGRKLLENIQEQARKMAALIEDLLQFSRTTRQPLERKVVNLSRLAQECYTELAPQCDGREIEFTVGALPEANGDPALLRQVMLNLLGNAVKYTRARSPARIEVGAKERGEETVYYVKDNGAGFDMRYADRLFGVFQRLHSAAQFEGTGVGLATVARIIYRHGGQVWAEAEIDKGATFFFTIGEAVEA